MVECRLGRVEAGVVQAQPGGRTGNKMTRFHGIAEMIVNGGGKLGHMPAAEWGSSARRFLTVWHG